MFDLEFGQPAGSSPLPGSRPAFSGILGCYGHAAVGPGCKRGGVDLLYCSHQVSCRISRGFGMLLQAGASRGGGDPAVLLPPGEVCSQRVFLGCFSECN